MVAPRGGSPIIAAIPIGRAGNDERDVQRISEVDMKNNRLRFLLSLSILTVMAFSPSLPATAAETGAYEIVPCSDAGSDPTSAPIKAFVGDKDPSGLNVRSGPGTDYPVLKTLPTDRPVVVAILGSAKGWLRIGYVWVCNDTGVTQIRLDGWVNSALIRFPVSCDTGMTLFSEPRDDAKVVAEIPGNSFSVTLIECRCEVRGTWIKIRYGKFEGWLRPASGCYGIGEASICSP
jgi:SH3-like domain-containing protein